MNNIIKDMPVWVIPHRDINKKEPLIPAIVSRVGKKYFYVSVSGGKELCFSLEHPYKYASDFSHLYTICLDKEKYLKDKESSEICSRLSSVFLYGRNHCNISLEDLQKIQDIVDKYTEK